MIPTISMSVWRRPEYTRMVLDALRENFGSEKYRLVVAVDVGDGLHKDVLDIVKAQAWPAELAVLVMPRPMGCNGTIFAALNEAFAKSDYVIHIEDDVLPARDALAWFEWGRKYRNDPSVWTIGAWRHKDGWLPTCGRDIQADEHAQAKREGFFTCWGWATWADRWAIMRDNWTDLGDFELSWDVRVSQLRENHVQIVPMISRAVNIGAMGGIHRGHAPLDYWRGSEPVTCAPEFREV